MTSADSKRARRAADPIRRIADRLEPSLRSSFLKAIAQLKGRIDLAALAAAIERHDFGAVDVALTLDQFPKDLQPAVRIINQGFHVAGTVTAELVASQVGGSLSFTLTNPRSVQWARQMSSRFITEISGTTREAVRELIRTGIADGIPVRQTARALKEQIGLTSRQMDAVGKFRDRLLEQGVSLGDVDRRTTRYAEAQLSKRAQLIARTETISSASQGQLEAWRQAADKHLLNPEETRRIWIVTHDDRLDATVCEPMDEQEVEFDQPFTTGDGDQVMAPPAHPGCRCATGLVFGR